MQDKKDMGEMNLLALERISAYLNQNARFITVQDVKEIMVCGVCQEEAVLLLLCAACGLDETAGEPDRTLVRSYFRESLRRLDADVYRKNPYMQKIRFPQKKLGRWEMKQQEYAPYELFVRDDLLCPGDGREIPQTGYFGEAFSYPAVLQDGREWMTVTPVEINTMAPVIGAAAGNVVAMGLGLGYFAFMASEKEEVSAVTIVERDRDAIELFRRHILPQFPHGEKIRIVEDDAFVFAKNRLPALKADCVFVDLWHDVSDGAPMYMRMKLLEPLSPKTRFDYWIETSIRAFLRSLGS